MASTDYLEEKIANHIFDGTAFTQPTEWFIGLYVTDPTDTGVAGTEVSGSGYARTAFTPQIGASPTYIITNNGDVTFPTATGDWTAANYIGIFDAVAGNMINYGPLDSSRTVLNGGVFKILDEQLAVQFT